jgi:hypothetical protein
MKRTITLLATAGVMLAVAVPTVGAATETGHGAKLQRELKLGLRRGWLDGYFGSGRRAVRDLNRLLRQTGYR